MKRITNEIKAKYFSLYYYRQVLGKYIDSDELTPIEDMNPCLVDYIELTPIEQISDEDAKESIKIWGKAPYPFGAITLNSRPSKWRRVIIEYLNELPCFVYQYLLSKGYALPYMDYSVSDLVENGTINFKTK
jgi:hypothetical protein